MDVEQSLGSRCQYEKVRFIGGGSFGKVYEAIITERTDYAGDEIVAVKAVSLTANVLENSELIGQLKRRLTSLLALKHQHVVSYHKATFLQQLDGLFLELLMDYCSGGDLSHLIKGNALLNDEPAVLCYAMQLSDGLKYLHSLGVIHGDIKPGNILVRPSEHLHHSLAIGDSDDYAQIQGSMTSKRDITHMRGTLRYMSPEMIRRYVQFATDEVVGRPTDIWSLGCVILDLANANGGNTSAELYKLDTAEKMEIENGFQWDGQYVRFISTDWTPFIGESVSESLASCIRPCFAAAIDHRIKADDLLENLIMKTCISTMFPSKDEKRDCVCKTRAPNFFTSSIEECIDPSSSEIALGSNCLYNVNLEKRVTSFDSGPVFAAEIIKRGNFAGEDIMIRCLRLEHIRNKDELISVCKAALTLKHAHLLVYHKTLIRNWDSCSDTRLWNIAIEAVMDYTDCYDKIAEWIENSRTAGSVIDQTTCMCYAGQLADALEFLHENHVIHGRLSPRNIFVQRSPNRHCRLMLDYFDSVDKKIDMHTWIFPIRSEDCPYMSPEMFRKSAGVAERHSVGCKTDIWSLGCIILMVANATAGDYAQWFYRKETGERCLITDDTIVETFVRNVFDGFVPYISKQVSQFLSGCIKQCIRINAAYRISAHDLSRILRDAAATATVTKDISGCDCRSAGTAAMSRTSLSSGADFQPKCPREVVITVLFCDYSVVVNNRFGVNIQVQWYDPMCGTLRPLPLRETFVCRTFLPIFFEKDNGVVCMFIDNSVQNFSDEEDFEISRIRIIKCDFSTQTWEHLGFIDNSTTFNVLTMALTGWTMATGTTVYIWTDFGEFPLQALNVLRGSLSPVAAPMPSMSLFKTPHGYGKAVILFHNNKIFCCSDDAQNKWMCYYDIEGNKWELCPDMLEARTSYAAAVLGNDLFIIGGLNDRNRAQKSCVRFSMENLSWTKIANLSKARMKHGSFVLDNKIYVFGGENSQIREFVLPEMEVYDTETDKWSNVGIVNLDQRFLDILFFKKTICMPVQWAIAENDPTRLG